MQPGEPHNLVEVLSRLDMASKRGAVNEQRHYERYSVRQSAILEPLNPIDGNREPIMIDIREVSLVGIGFLSQAPVELNSLWRIRFIDEKVFIGSQPAFICHTQMVQDGLYMIGAQFAIEPVMLQVLGVPTELFLKEQYHQNEGADYSDFLSPDELD